MPRVDASQCAAECWVRMGVYGYPYLHASDEDGGLETRNDTDGILLVHVPAGRHRIRLEFSTRSRVRMVGAGISLAGILLVGFGIVRSRRRVNPLIA
jgi:uncharacterized membrane protein YfhO